MINFSYSIWLLLIPLMMFITLGLAGHKLKPRLSGLLGTSGLAIVTILSYIIAYNYFFVTPKNGEAFKTILAFNTTWLQLTDYLHIDIGIVLDPISVMMLIVVSTVSFMVHIYSLGYMKGERGFERFFAFLSLFTFSMLGLVVATNIFQMYIFWELVGISSYLLIGFYYQKPSAVAASKKAFIVTRFADLGFLIGILILIVQHKTFDFITLTDPKDQPLHRTGACNFHGTFRDNMVDDICFYGRCRKISNVPVPHLASRCHGRSDSGFCTYPCRHNGGCRSLTWLQGYFRFMYLAAPDALDVVAYVGAFSSLFAAIIACTQTDIKRVLAYSTMSQIGYMMLALGVSGYGGHEGLGFMASMFHLFTHAIFKALLFLGAGAIIHAVHSNYMTDMGGSA